MIFDWNSFELSAINIPKKFFMCSLDEIFAFFTSKKIFESSSLDSHFPQDFLYDYSIS